MTTPPRIWRPRNRQRTCSAPGCHRRRRHTSRHCRPHERRQWLYGHINGRYIRKQDIAPYRRIMSGFLDRYAETPQVEAALRITTSYLNNPIGSPKASTRLATLAADAVTARDVLEVAGAVWMLSHYQPRTLPDDQRLTHQLGYHVFALRTLPQRYRHRWVAWGEPQSTNVKTITPGGPARREIGGWARSSLGVFFMNVIRAIEAERKAVQEQEAAMANALAEPFHATPNPHINHPIGIQRNDIRPELEPPAGGWRLIPVLVGGPS